MTWIKRQLEKIKKPKKKVSKKVEVKKDSAQKDQPIKKETTPKVEEAKKQAVIVDKELSQKGITVPKGKEVTSVDSTPKTKATGWKPNTNLPARSRGKSKTKGMSR